MTRMLPCIARRVISASVMPSLTLSSPASPERLRRGRTAIESVATPAAASVTGSAVSSKPPNSSRSNAPAPPRIAAPSATIATRLDENRRLPPLDAGISSRPAGVPGAMNVGA